MKVKQFKHRKSTPVHRASSTQSRLAESERTTVLAEPLQVDVLPTRLMAPEHALRPISSKVMFWRPRYLADSQWLQHVPFYFWLTEVIRPNVVVEPNLNSAVGYFAICQAIDKLNHDGLAYGAFGSQCNIEQVSRYNHEHYREFSHLGASDESTFISDFDDASIDLLMLKPGTPLLVSESAQTGLSPLLQSKLSAHAVVLIHGSMLSEHRPLCASLRSNYPSFELTQHNGLLLLCMGKQIPAQLETLISQGKDARAQRLIQNIYARLGSANQDAWQCRVYERQVHELTEQLQAQTHYIQQIKGAKQAFADKLQQASQDVATAKAHQAELAAKLAALGDETAEKRKQKQQLVQEKTQLEQELTVLKKSRQQAAADMARLQQDMDVRFDELAKLTQLLVDAESRLDAVQQDNQSLRQQLSQMQSELTRAQAEKSQANNQKIEAQIQLDKATAELATTQIQLQREQELTTQLERDQQVAADKISTLANAELALQLSLNERFDELATLTNMLQQQEQQYEMTLSELQAAQLQLKEQRYTAVTDKLKNTFKTARQRRAKARQFAVDVSLIRQSELFDEAWYLEKYPEAAHHKQGAAGHYLEYGVELGANPSATFDGNWYLSIHSDVKDAGMNPLFHYLKFGHKESRLLKHF
ncbi:coiled-coil domain-containing protein [Aeromonas veronii]|uniref:hypothetical protein n=1 Tax=Aeromonas veronii TaxID=654 RepID=UPI002B4941A5|nr:hypothetical protein [Aeromonas veronii]